MQCGSFARPQRFGSGTSSSSLPKSAPAKFNSNASVRGRHRLQPKQAASVGEIPSSQGGNTKSKSLSCAGGQPWLAQFSQIFKRGQSGSSQASSTEHCTTGDTSHLLTAGPATTTSTTLRLKPDDDDDMSPQRATRVNLCSHQVSNCPVCPRASGGVVGRRWLSHAMSRPGTCQVSTPLRQSPPREQFRGQGGRRAMRTEWEWCSTVHLRSSQRKRTTWTVVRSVSTTPRLQCMALSHRDRSNVTNKPWLRTRAQGKDQVVEGRDQVKVDLAERW